MSLQAILGFFNQYSNLMLAIITLMYVFLTWGMVREMRQARKAELEPLLIATPVPITHKHVKLRIQNAGRGPALNIETTLYFEPANNTKPHVWAHPVLLSGAFEDFLMPGSGIKELAKLAAEHDRVVVDLMWSNVFGRNQKAQYEFNPTQLEESWSRAELILPSEDIPTQLKGIRDEISKIRSQIETTNRDRQLSNLIAQHHPKHLAWQRLRQWFLDQARKVFNSPEDSN
jgi:hypothetical protein